MPSDESSNPTETAVEAAPAPDDPETVRTLARETLTWCRENPGDPEALPRLNTVLELVHDPALSKEVLSAGEVITRHVIAEAAPTPATHAHMTVLMALLLEYEPTRDAVDALFVEWLKHPRSYGPAHATPPTFQRETFVQRLGDLLGWGTLDVRRDREALTRFAHWVDTWTPRNKFRSRHPIDAVRRNFPAPDIWNVIRFPQGNEGPRRDHGGGGGRRDAKRSPDAKKSPDATPAAATPGDGNDEKP